MLKILKNQRGGDEGERNVDAKKPKFGFEILSILIVWNPVCLQEIRINIMLPFMKPPTFYLVYHMCLSFPMPET